MRGPWPLIAGFLAWGFLGALSAQIPRELPDASAAIELTPEESAWLAEHPVIPYGADPKWPPFSIREGEELRGVDPEIMALLGERLGVRFEYVPSSSWKETMQLFKRGEIAFITGMTNVEGRDLDVIYTDPYVGFPWAMIMRTDAPFYTDLAQLEREGKGLVVPKDYASHVYLRRHHPGIRLTTTETALEALLEVSSGRVAASMDNVGVAAHLIKTNGLSNLKINGLIKGDFGSAFGVRRDLPELHRILDKAIDSVSERERLAIYDQWVLVDLSKIRDWKSVVVLVGVLLLVALSIIGVVTMWNRRLTAELEKRKAAEESLRRSEARFRQLFDTMQDPYFITRVGGEIQLVNEAALVMLQLGSRPLIQRLNIEALLRNPDDLEQLTGLLRREGRVRDHLIEFVRADGSDCVCRCQVRLLTEESGEEVGIEFVARPE